MKLPVAIIMATVLIIPRAAMCDDKVPGAEKLQDDDSSAQRDRAYQAMGAAILTAVGDRHKLALIKPEKEGTTRSLYDLERWLTRLLEANTVEVVTPDDVLKCAGVEFPITSEGIGQVAKDCKAPAALYVMWKEHDSKTDVSLLMAGPQGETMLALSVDIPQPPPPMQAPAKLVHSASDQPGHQPGVPSQEVKDAPPPSLSAEEIFKQRKPTIQGDDPRSWKVLLDEQAIGELELARMGSRQDLVDQLQNEISHLKTLRTSAIIMTIGGFVALGLSMPMLNDEGDTQTAGWIVAGLGAAVGVTGGTMWWLWGDEATRAGGPDPVRHLLTPAQTRELVQNYNSSLRKELDLKKDKDAKHVSWYFNPGMGGVLSAGVSLRF